MEGRGRRGRRPERGRWPEQWPGRRRKPPHHRGMAASRLGCVVPPNHRVDPLLLLPRMPHRIDVPARLIMRHGRARRSVHEVRRRPSHNLPRIHTPQMIPIFLQIPSNLILPQPLHIHVRQNQCGRRLNAQLVDHPKKVPLYLLRPDYRRPFTQTLMTLPKLQPHATFRTSRQLRAMASLPCRPHSPRRRPMMLFQPP